METLHEFIEGILIAAVIDHGSVTLVHEGEPARYVAMMPDGTALVAIASHGNVLQLPRVARLIVQPIDRVMLLPPCCELARWSTT